MTQGPLEPRLLRRHLEALGLQGAPVAVHTSLRSLLPEGGLGSAERVIETLTDWAPAVMMPAFSWGSNTAPPPGDRPPCNGCDYAFYEGWSKPRTPFRVESAGVEPSMGQTSRVFATWPGVRRSDHPWHSWAAWGEGATELVADHPWDTTNLPLERLAERGGWVVLLGVGLRSCTALHVAEERAGRRPFIRWAVDREGRVRRVHAAGCAKGFDHLLPALQREFVETTMGPARILAAPLTPLIRAAAAIFRDRPELGRCSPTCLRCRDAILGGPPLGPGPEESP